MHPTLRCRPELLHRDLSGATYVITGANSGTGLATAKQLVSQGAHVIMGCRRVDAGEAARADITAGARGTAEVGALDLARLASVRAFAGEVLESHPRIDGLVNNAGVMNTPDQKTEDGFEFQLGINHLGHFLLTELLLDRLKESAPSRVVNVSSSFHVNARGREGKLDFDDLHFEQREYDGWEAYAQSKLAMVLHALELGRRLEGTNVSAFSLHPGWVRTNLARHTMPLWVQNLLIRPLGGLVGLISPEDGAQTTLHCLLDDAAPRHSGEYYSQKGIYPEKKHRTGGWPMRSPSTHANDPALAKRLHEVSLRSVGLTAE